MIGDPPLSPGFWKTVLLLLVMARKRAIGRRKRTRQLFRNRSGGAVRNWGGFGVLIVIAVMAGLNIMAAFVVEGSVTAAQRVVAEQQGWIVVDDWFAKRIEYEQASARRSNSPWRDIDWAMAPFYQSEASHLADNYGGNAALIVKRMRDAVLNHQTNHFIGRERAAPGLKALFRPGGFPAMLGSIALLWWGVMLALQGEGLDLDVQRRRHPMWEWLFSHPVPSGAVFLAEMLSPLAANPIYYTAPLMPGVLYGSIYGPALGCLAVFVIGVPLTLAASCVGKGLEIGVMLRFAPRSRGVLIGLMGWLGYASMMLFFVGLFVIEKFASIAAGPLRPLARLPWPWLGMALGQKSDGLFSFVTGMLTCDLLAAILIAGSVGFSIWSVQKGLSGSADRLAVGPRPARTTGVRFGKDPLYRKELMWFARDRSAIVQVVLVPLTLAAVQLFNLRGLLAEAQSAWNTLCGTAILFGTYFISVLGPKSLASEGSALWIAMTWPRGLESLLKAKAWLWAMISTVVVAVVLCYAAFAFPADVGGIGLVGIGWLLFARSMADKAVTLATVTGPSGELEKIPAGRRWATQLGTLTFALGVLSRQWSLAITGIVYSMMTAAALWQNFRAHLPYLYDPWSERLPAPPTLMHAMIAISLLVEGNAVLTSASLAFAGRDTVAVVRALVYGLCAAGVSLGFAEFLAHRGVSQTGIWFWRSAEPGEASSPSWWRRSSLANRRFVMSLLVGLGLGLVLGLLGRGYVALLQDFPWTAELLDRSHAAMDAIPHLREAVFVMGVMIAPPAEEFLFRGLLYRALDREWQGWQAVAGSAAFFAIYHPPLAWLPVGMVGIANAVLFKKTGYLAPAVLLHMVYNAIVLY